MPSVITANRLRTGAVVYLTGDGRWVERLADASVVSGAAELAAFEALALDAVRRNDVTAVYAFEVDVAGGTPTPVSVRERLRAHHAASL